MHIRETIYRLVEAPNERNSKTDLYDTIMFVSIIISIVPLGFKKDLAVFDAIDKYALVVFTIDYLLRWSTADLKLGKGFLSFLKYPFTPMAIVDLLSILPSITALKNGYRFVRILRLSKVLRTFRIFKMFRYSQSITLIVNVFRRQKDSLLTMCWVTGGYIFISALIIFNVEPQSFDTFFDALYWATISFTTIGYGDIHPVTTVGRIITMISSIFGIAVIAMPTGIITAGILEELNKDKK